MSQGKTSQNIPLETHCLSDAQLECREKMLRIAANPQTPSDSLRDLSYSSDRLIRKTVAGNPNTPRDILFKLGEEFPDALINNPVWELLFLEDPSLTRDLPLSVQHHLLYQEDVPYYLMELMATAGDFHVGLGLARHPKTPYTILQELFKQGQNPLREAVQLHIKWLETPQESLEEIITAVLEHRSSQNSTKITLMSLVETGLFFDLMGRGNPGNNQEINEVSHPSLWIQGLKNLRTQKIKEQEIFQDKGLSKNKILENLLSQLSQDYHPTLKKYFSGNSQAYSAIFPDIFLLETSSKNPSPAPPKIPSLASRWLQKFNFIPFILESIAGSFYTPHWLLSLLAKSRFNFISFILESIAGSFYTPHWLLSLLANGNLSLRRKVLTNPNLPGSILEKLAMDNNVLVQRDVAKHPNTPASALEVLAWVPDSQVRSDVAKHLNTGLFDLLTLAIDPVMKVRREIAKNPRTPTLALELLAMDDNIRVRVEVVKHCNVPLSYLESLVNDYNFYIKTGVPVVVEPTQMTIEWLKPIIREENFEVKNKIFSIFQIPLSWLEKLATDPDSRVRQGIANYRYLPSFLVHQLTQDTHLGIRCSAINHPNMSVSMLRELLCDRNLYNDSDKIYRQVAFNYLKHNPKGLPLVLKKIADYSTDSFERLVVLLHPKILPSTLAQNWRSLDWVERYCIAQHPNTPSYTLAELVKDGNRIVRTVAWNNLIQRQKPNPLLQHPDNATADNSG
ncbi:hypothetical protein Oscil6304_0936 [Oscillatoria acuminata PCC 6304]|uniref:Leucine rich repeat protein n=2 Tax=Oscillatoria acuminata TaxID=118323 RepID=K9TE17_9CYAN|nr:hypothetical protein Oscil6304_0936 [Oscillatoria acuminata PCC 6304]